MKDVRAERLRLALRGIPCAQKDCRRPESDHLPAAWYRHEEPHDFSPGPRHDLQRVARRDPEKACVVCGHVDWMGLSACTGPRHRMLTELELDRLRSSEETRAALWDRANELRRELAEIEARMKEETGTDLGVLAPLLNADPTSMELGPWRCPTSPLKVCVYGMLLESDPEAYDGDKYCLYCSQPSERK